MGIVTKDRWKFFVPFNCTARLPDGVPCRKDSFFRFHPIFDFDIGYRRS